MIKTQLWNAICTRDYKVCCFFYITLSKHLLVFSFQCCVNRSKYAHYSTKPCKVWSSICEILFMDNRQTAWQIKWTDRGTQFSESPSFHWEWKCTCCNSTKMCRLQLLNPLQEHGLKKGCEMAQPYHLFKNQPSLYVTWKMDNYVTHNISFLKEVMTLMGPYN